MSEEKKFNLLIVGLQTKASDFIKSFLPNAIVQEFKSNEVEKLIESPPTEIPHLIVCGIEVEGINPIEIGQFLRSQFQDTSIYFVSVERTKYDKSSLIKNGFNDSFILSIDQAALKSSLMTIHSTAGNKVTYRSVKLVDIEPNSVLDFDISVFLPMNKKYVLFAPSGQAMGTEKSDRLQKNSIQSVHVPHNQIKKFYEYTSKQLQKVNNNSGMSETERREKMQKMIRNLLTDLLGNEEKTGTFEQGKAIMEDCQKIVSSFLVSTTQNDWFKKMMSGIDEDESSSHVGNVSHLAALFSMALNIGKPEDLAIAGILHDIGIAQLPLELQDKPAHQRTPDEQILYQKHIEYSIEMIKSQKIILSDHIIKIILQHHEEYSGTGYPKQLIADKVLAEAQILSLADEFDYLTRVRPNHPRLSPADAIKKIQFDENQNPGKRRFSADLIKKWSSLFLNNENI